MLAALVLTACTGRDAGAPDDAEAVRDEQTSDAVSSVTDFAAAHEAAAERYADALADVQSAGLDAVRADPVGAHEVYDQLRTVTEIAADEFGALSPPTEVADLHAVLVELLAEQARTLRRVVAASQDRDDRALDAHLADYAQLLADWRERLGELTDHVNDAEHPAARGDPHERPTGEDPR